MPSAVIKCPFPFPDWEASADVQIFQEFDTEDQGMQETLIYEGKAIFDQKAITVFNSESKQVALSGKLIIHGDVQQIGSIGEVQGYVIVNGDKKQMYQMSKPQLLGQVHTTEITLK